MVASQYEACARLWHAWDRYNIHGFNTKLILNIYPELEDISVASKYASRLVENGFLKRIRRGTWPKSVVYILTEKGVETGESIYSDPTISRYPIDLDDLYLIDILPMNTNEYRSRLLNIVENT
jgi:hypothetical protein